MVEWRRWVLPGSGSSESQRKQSYQLQLHKTGSQKSDGTQACLPPVFPVAMHPQELQSCQQSPPTFAAFLQPVPHWPLQPAQPAMLGFEHMLSTLQALSKKNWTWVHLLQLLLLLRFLPPPPSCSCFSCHPSLPWSRSLWYHSPSSLFLIHLLQLSRVITTWSLQALPFCRIHSSASVTNLQVSTPAKKLLVACQRSDIFVSLRGCHS